MNLYCVQLLSTLSLSQVREIFLLLNLSLTCIFLFAYHSEKKEKKNIYIYTYCVGGPVCVLRQWNLPARSVTDKNIPQEVQCWKRRISGHFMRSPGKGSLLFPTPIVPLLWKDLGASVKLDASQQAPWDRLLCRASWP